MTARLHVHESDIPVRTDRGGEYRVMITPMTVRSTQLIMGTASVGPGGRVQPHVHEHSEETFVVVEGQGRIHLHGHSVIEFAAGDAVLVPKGIVHEIENTGDGEMRVVFAAAPLAPTPASGHRNLKGTAQ